MKIIKALLLILAVVVLAAGGLVGYLTLTEYRPDDIEQLEVTQAARSDNVRVGERLDVLTFNTGYCGLGRDQDFFMDGGSMVRPENKEIVQENMNGILSELARQNADVYLLQEVDFDSYRSYYVNQADTYRRGIQLQMRFCALPLAAAWQGGKRPGQLYGPECDAGDARKPAGALHLAHARGQPQALPAGGARARGGHG